jgi:hypothetical protein
VDVLNKVGVLATLPDDIHCTTEMVATFYEVDREAVRQVVTRNRDELDDDGYRVVTRTAFESDIASLSNLDPKVRTVALFPRRAVLRIGMLLRDSEIARRVRDYLLAVEQIVRDDNEDQIIERALSILMDRNKALTAKIEEDRPLVERAKNHAAGAGAKTRQQFFREIKQWAQTEHGIQVRQEEVMTFLSTKKLGLFISGCRSDSGQATAWAIEKGYARNPEGTARNGHNFVRPIIEPLGQQYAWDRVVRYIEAHGTLRLPKGDAA